MDTGAWGVYSLLRHTMAVFEQETSLLKRSSVGGGHTLSDPCITETLVEN